MTLFYRLLLQILAAIALLILVATFAIEFLEDLLLLCSNSITTFELQLFYFHPAKQPV